MKQAFINIILCSIGILYSEEFNLKMKQNRFNLSIEMWRLQLCYLTGHWVILSPQLHNYKHLTNIWQSNKHAKKVWQIFDKDLMSLGCQDLHRKLWFGLNILISQHAIHYYAIQYILYFPWQKVIVLNLKVICTGLNQFWLVYLCEAGSAPTKASLLKRRDGV